MAKWFLLVFMMALTASGWWASQDDAPEWAPAAPTLVLAVGVLIGIVVAVRHGHRRRSEMAEVASRMGLGFETARPRERLQEAGLGTLASFGYCRPTEQLSFLQRTVQVHFHNVMSGPGVDGELLAFDYSTSAGSGAPSQRGTFACFRMHGGSFYDLEILPRLWGDKPAWLEGATEASPARSEVLVDHGAFAEEYRAFSASAGEARTMLTDEILGFFSGSGETGWRVETRGEWMAVTRLAPAKVVGGLTDPMTPELLRRELRYSYFEHPIEPVHAVRFIERARRIYRMLSSSRRS